MAGWFENNMSAIREYPFDFDCYLEERLREILSYGAQEGIGPERVSAMMRELRREQDEAEKQPHDGQKEIRF